MPEIALGIGKLSIHDYIHIHSSVRLNRRSLGAQFDVLVARYMSDPWATENKDCDLRDYETNGLRFRGEALNSNESSSPPTGLSVMGRLSR